MYTTTANQIMLGNWLFLNAIYVFVLTDLLYYVIYRLVCAYVGGMCVCGGGFECMCVCPSNIYVSVHVVHFYNIQCYIML